MDNSDHDILIRNTVLTEETHRRVTEALQQLARGNDRFQRVDADLQAQKARIENLEARTAQDIATLRGDMLRAMGSVVDRTSQNTDAAIKPLREQLEPVTETLKRTHTIVKWLATTVGAIVVAVITAIAVAYAMHWISIP